MNSTHSNIVDNKYFASVAFTSDCEAHNLITEEVSLFYSIVSDAPVVFIYFINLPVVSAKKSTNM